MSDKINYVIVDVFNGDGYSEPIIKTATSLEQAEQAKRDLVKAYGDTIQCVTSYDQTQVSFDYNNGSSDSDNAMVKIFKSNAMVKIFKSNPESEQLIKSTDTMHYLIVVEPDECKATMLMGSNREGTIRMLLTSLVMDNNVNYDHDDLNAFKPLSDNKFSSHSDDGFVHLEIVSFPPPQQVKLTVVKS